MLTSAIERLFLFITIAPLLVMALPLLTADLRAIFLVFYLISSYKLVTLACTEFDDRLKAMANQIKNDNLKQAVYKGIVDSSFTMVNKYLNTKT